ncbi:phosphonate ABC transporter ATP-binding protein [Paenibacillus sp. IB182496]|uniref:Phosphonate ABC transporter ATP-binding protein n=1 Tax=Paenibacillus sabuli TaxID=2772509 RepID=A0A927BWI9_9BACL|nr:phosphonate ABC transporter ATP-binding protein [Paenibacillus sabuli]MBD2848173.1 phosphonate ABC transporter ATP-binding protein [Paenibacillus sabuli]
MLELIGLNKRYKGEAEAALDGVHLRVQTGEFVAVLGRSGAGKSTLIRCVNRLVEPDAGRVLWQGRDLTAMSAAELRRARMRIGMVFQHYHLLPRLSVLTNALAGRFGAMPRWRSLPGWYTASERALAAAALREVGLEALGRRRVEELSGGQKQRVAIARVLVQQPELLLGDEPISSLDSVTAARIMRHIASLHRERGMTVLLNLHDVAVARAHASRIIGLAGGRIVYDGSPEALDETALARIYADEAAPDLPIHRRDRG